jgi:hypothetical protein
VVVVVEGGAVVRGVDVEARVPNDVVEQALHRRARAAAAVTAIVAPRPPVINR